MLNTVNDAFRDYVTDGVPASGEHNPSKSHIRDTLNALLGEDSEDAADVRDHLGLSDIYNGIANLTALKALTPSAGDWAFVTATGRAGFFVFDSSDLSTEVTADAAEGIYVPPDSDSTGLSGAWIRRYDGKINVKWFGATGDGATDDTSALQAAIDWAANTSSKQIHLPEGTYVISAKLTCTVSGVVIEGAGMGSRESSNARHPTLIQWNSTADEMLEYGDGGTTTLFGCIIRDIAFDGNDVANGIRLNQKCSNFVLENVLVFDAADAFRADLSSFANRFINCVAYGFTSRGFRFTARNHNTLLIGCKTWGGSAKTPTYSVAIGETEWSSGISMVGCDFEAWNVSEQVHVTEASALTITNCYMEAKDATTTALIVLGSTVGPTTVQGFKLSGCYLIGNTAAQRIVRLVNVDGGEIGGNLMAGFTSEAIQATSGGVVNVLLGSNKIPTGTECNLYTGITKMAGDKIGFFGATPLARQTVAGSRGGNAALGSLLTVLANYGLITNSTTA